MKTLTIDAFECFDFDVAEFDHAAHLAIAWTYLDRFEGGIATDRFRRALRALTEHVGAPGKYHETITRFYLELIEVHRRNAPAIDAGEFMAKNPELLDPGLLNRHYSPECLGSDEARRAFLPPDRAPLPRAA